MNLHGDLPPVGNKISLGATSGNKLAELLPSHQYWVDSGTSALALALGDAKNSFPHLTRPRAIIPGYCCPDLVAACVFAGVEPVAVDIARNDPAYDLESLRTVMDETVVAVIAINFLGVSERIAQIRELIAHLGLQARLVVDNAQWFPVSQTQMKFDADYVTFSFGRGKPLSLLGGGLLQSKTPLDKKLLQKIEEPTDKPALVKLKARAYNLLLIPQFYILLNRNPFMRLGETKYSPLEKITRMDDYRLSLLTENFECYSQCDNHLQQEYNREIPDGLQQFGAVYSGRCQRLLRYPLLCPDSQARDTLLTCMQKEGLGATAMYKVAIDQIEGVAGLVSVPLPLNNAKSFASRFMTLPVQSGVGLAFQKKILSLLKSK